MKKILLTFILTLTVFAFATGQDISSVIRSMPDDITLKIGSDQKEILATINDTANVVVNNILGGKVERVAVSPDYVAIKTSDIGMLQIKLLPLINHSYIVGVIRTVCDIACDSQIDFYTTDWKPLTNDELFPDKNKDWFIKKDIDRASFQFKNAYAPLDMTPVKYVFVPDATTVTAVYDIEKYLSEDDYKLLKPYLTETPIVFSWDKTSFKEAF